MMTLDLMWWLGWLYFAAWTVLPLAMIGIAGPIAGVLMWAALAPWSALLGMSVAHRLLPAAEEGTFRMFADRGSVRWALKGWAPSVYLGVFQPVFFLSTGFQRVALRAFGARLAPGAQVTTRTSIREPHLLELGRDSFIGEYAHLVCSYQPRPRMLVVARIKIGDGVLIGAYSVLGGGCRVGSRCIVEYRVSLGAHSWIGEDTRIGAGTSIRNGARIGSGVRIGKLCRIGLGAVVPDGARLADGTVWPAVSAASGGASGS